MVRTLRNGPLPVAALLALSLAACGVPDHRISVNGIPAKTAQLQVAAYVDGALTADTPTFAVTGPRDRFTFGLNLPATSGAPPTISVAARDASGCLLAVGTQTELPPASSDTDGQLDLSVPEPAVGADACTAAPPVLLAAIRRQAGPLSALRYSLLLQGWGLAPATRVSIKSTALVQCATGSLCNTACPTACTGGMGGMGGPGSGTCLTGCALTLADSDIIHVGPALIEVNFDPARNILQSLAAQGSGAPLMQPIDLLQLLSQPLQITLTDPNGATVTFTEKGVEGPRI